MSVYGSQIKGGFWTISKTLAAYFKCVHTVMILDELIFHENKHRETNLKNKTNGWFFYPVEDLQIKCFIGERVRKRCFQALVEAKVLKIEKKGVPARFWYKLDLGQVDAIITSVGTSPLQMSGTGEPQMSGTGEPQMSGTINKKVIKKKEEEVIVEKDPTPSTSNSDFLEFKDYIESVPYYKRLKALGAMKRVWTYYGGLDAFKLNYERLYADYCKRKQFPNDNGPKDELWYSDCYESIENKMLKESAKNVWIT